VPYDTRDPRSKLHSRPVPGRVAGACFAPQYFEFPKLEPDEVSPAGSKTWLVRSQSCCLAFTLARQGDTLRRDDQPDEYMVLLPSADSSVMIRAGDEQADVDGSAVVVVPPGASEIAVGASGVVVRVFSPQAQDLLSRCRNADVYVEPDPNVTPFEPWPDPPAGHHIRVYPLADIKSDPGRFGRILRCSTLMINYFYVDDGPRDPHVMSPHHHDDFEQLSLQLDGDYVHHIRTPWTVDMEQWRDDDHQFCASPALTVIPPPTVHTSQSVHHMPHQLIDIFCPPRLDFSERPGWVLNADEYPMPVAEAAPTR
jgi:hypothetical protein